MAWRRSSVRARLAPSERLGPVDPSLDRHREVRAAERRPPLSVAWTLTRSRRRASPRDLAGRSGDLPRGHRERTDRADDCASLAAARRRAACRTGPAGGRSGSTASASSESVVVSLKAFPVRALPERLSAPRTGAEFAAPPPGAGPPGAPVIAADAEAMSSAEDAPGVEDATVAAAVSVPAAPARSTIVTVTCAPAATVPSSHRTALVQLPTEGTAATTSAAPDGVTSRVAASAGSKPVLVDRGDVRDVASRGDLGARLRERDADVRGELHGPDVARRTGRRWSPALIDAIVGARSRPARSPGS